MLRNEEGLDSDRKELVSDTDAQKAGSRTSSIRYHFTVSSVIFEIAL